VMQSCSSKTGTTIEWSVLWVISLVPPRGR
jgi:hypothetical protein